VVCIGATHERTKLINDILVYVHAKMIPKKGVVNNSFLHVLMPVSAREV
jgi:hypothetical protein